MQISFKGSMNHRAGGWDKMGILLQNDLISGVKCFLLPFIQMRSEIYGRSSCLAYSRPQEPGFRKPFKKISPVVLGYKPGILHSCFGLGLVNA